MEQQVYQVKTEFDDTQVKDGLKLVKELNVELEKANLLLDRLLVEILLIG